MTTYRWGRLFSIHLKIKRPDTPLVERKKEKDWGQFDIFNVMAKSKISFQSIYLRGHVKAIERDSGNIWESVPNEESSR
jgi:hypothetical protein